MSDDKFVENGDWKEYKQLFILEIDRSAKWQEKVTEQLTDLKVEVAMLKVKSAMWGSVAAIILTILLNFTAQEVRVSKENKTETQLMKRMENLEQQVEKTGIER